MPHASSCISGNRIAVRTIDPSRFTTCRISGAPTVPPGFATLQGRRFRSTSSDLPITGNGRQSKPLIRNDRQYLVWGYCGVDSLLKSRSAQALRRCGIHLNFRLYFAYTRFHVRDAANPPLRLRHLLQGLCSKRSCSRRNDARYLDHCQVPTMRREAQISAERDIQGQAVKPTRT